MKGIEKAVKNAGGAGNLAEQLGVSYEAVRLWRKLGFVPQKSVFDVEDKTGVSCFELNPTVYPVNRFIDVSLKQAS
jgi:DNA-binding transcriptional regulator YdaS (Cro superfamily)